MSRAIRMRRDLQSRRRHFFNRRVSMVNYVAPDAQPEEMLVDDRRRATVRQLGDALTELEVNGHFFGECSLTLVPARDRRARAAAPDGRGHEGHGRPRREPVRRDLQPAERLAQHRAGQRRPQPAAPGAARNESRGPELPLHARTKASAVSPHLGREALAVFETPHHTPYSLQPARPGRRAHPRAGRDRQRQELPAELPGDARAEVRAR